MKVNIILTLLFLVLFLTNKTFAQNFAMGASLNLGKSKITNNSDSFSAFTKKYSFSGNAGLFFEKKMNEKSYLGLEGLWIQLRGRESLDRSFIAIDGSNIINIQEINSYLSYIGLSVYYRYRFRKLGFRGGVQTMKFLFGTATGSHYINSDYNTTHSYSENSDIKRMKYNVGPKVGLDYQLTKAIRIRSDFYYGIPDISIYTSTKKVRQITLGVDYIIGTPKT